MAVELPGINPVPVNLSPHAQRQLDDCHGMFEVLRVKDHKIGEIDIKAINREYNVPISLRGTVGPRDKHWFLTPTVRARIIDLELSGALGQHGGGVESFENMLVHTSPFRNSRCS